MASSSITTPTHQITPEEFNLFHAIDRRLFSTLIFGLAKNPTDATQVMALWIWLERTNLRNSIVHAILSLPYQTMDTLFDESMLCLHVAAYGLPANRHVPVLNALLKGKNIDVALPYFHENNTMVLHGVGNIVEEVCLRAFHDIVEQFRVGGSDSGAGQVTSHEVLDFGPGFGTGSNGYDAINGDDLLDEIEELHTINSRMGFMNINNDGFNREEENLGEGREVRGRGSNNKTLFLTFSKGYPISKAEVREFFNTWFGDVIEGLHMQEVPRNEQPLYARLVVRDLATMENVLQGQRKVKFNINGKHACVRKYVRKRSESPSSPPAQD